MKSMTAYVQLFILTDSEATARITERLALVLKDPAAYQAEYAEELAERGIETKLPAQELRDVALIDALFNEDLLWEADWKDSAADMAEGLNEVLERQKQPVMLNFAPVVGNYHFGPEQLDDLQDALEKLGYALVLCTLGSDSFPLSLVAEEQVETTRALAEELGFKIMVY